VSSRLAPDGASDMFVDLMRDSFGSVLLRATWLPIET